MKTAIVQLCGSWIRVYDGHTNRDVADYTMPEVNDDMPDSVCGALFDRWLAGIKVDCARKGYIIPTVMREGREIIKVGN